MIMAVQTKGNPTSRGWKVTGDRVTSQFRLPNSPPPSALRPEVRQRTVVKLCSLGSRGCLLLVSLNNSLFRRVPLKLSLLVPGVSKKTEMMISHFWGYISLGIELREGPSRIAFLSCRSCLCVCLDYVSSTLTALS